MRQAVWLFQKKNSLLWCPQVQSSGVTTVTSLLMQRQSAGSGNPNGQSCRGSLSPSWVSWVVTSPSAMLSSPMTNPWAGAMLSELLVYVGVVEASPGKGNLFRWSWRV